MPDKEEIHIAGHRHPDTDSIASAIAYAKLRQRQGFHAIACRLGPVNAETEYLFERFHMDLFMLFEDTRAALDEIEIDGPLVISPQTTTMETLELMSEQNKQSYGVINAQGKLMGMITKSDLVTAGLGGIVVAIQLLQETPPGYITRTVNEKVIYMDRAYHFNGKTNVIVTVETKSNNYELQDRLAIVENGSEAQGVAIRKGVGILITVWTEHTEESVITLTREYHCPTILLGHRAMNTSRYLFFSPPVKLPVKIDLVSFNKDEFVDEVGKKMLKSRYRNYPVIDDENYLIDYVSHYRILDQHNKKAVLVNHNEYAQSVKSIKEADSLETVDHHRICDISTNRPISLRDEIIGSTASVIVSIYLENQMSVPKDITGLPLGIVLPDTLKFKPPITTTKDKGLAKMLTEITELDIDIFAKEILKISSNISNRTPRELLNQDIKKFEIDGRTVMTLQAVAHQVGEAKEIEDILQNKMMKFVQKKGLDLLVVASTNMLESGSIFCAVGDIIDMVAEAFPNHFGEEHSFQEDILSRKNQIVPLLPRAVINSVHRLSKETIPERIVFFTVCQVWMYLTHENEDESVSL